MLGRCVPHHFSPLVRAIKLYVRYILLGIFNERRIFNGACYISKIFSFSLSFRSDFSYFLRYMRAHRLNSIITVKLLFRASFLSINPLMSHNHRRPPRSYYQVSSFLAGVDPSRLRVRFWTRSLNEIAETRPAQAFRVLEG